MSLLNLIKEKEKISTLSRHNNKIKGSYPCCWGRKAWAMLLVGSGIIYRILRPGDVL
jgi:hypothetical protein